MAEKRVTIELAKTFNAAIREMIAVSEDAVDRLEKSGSTDFLCSNYRQAVMGAGFIAKYVRDFAGSAATASIESDIAAILESVTPPKLQVVAEDVEKFKKSRKKRSQSDE